METTIPHSTPAQAPGPSAWRETGSTAYPNEEVRSKAGNSKVIVVLCYCWVTYQFSSLNLYNFIILLSVCQELEHGLAGLSFQGISRLKVSAGDAISFRLRIHFRVTSCWHNQRIKSVFSFKASGQISLTSKRGPVSLLKSSPNRVIPTQDNLPT